MGAWNLKRGAVGADLRRSNS